MLRFAGLILASAIVAAACSLSELSADYGKPGPDASTDAPAASDGSRTGCAGAIFCDDFDGEVAYVKWDDAPPPAGAGISLDTTTAVSSPRSVRLQCGNDRICQLHKSLPKMSRMRIEFDLLLVTAPPTPRGIWSFSFDQSDEYIEITHRPDRTTFAICHQTGCWGDGELVTLKGGGFHHLRIDVTFGDAGRADVFVDGTQEITNAQPVPRADFERGVFYLGDANTSPGAVSDIRVDNFAISAF